MGISLEAVSLLIVLVLALFHRDNQQHSSRRYRLFNGCLSLSSAAIALNIASSVCINATAQVPLWLNGAVSTLYFLAQHANLTALMGYGLYLINEHVPNRHCFRMSGSIVLGLGAALEIVTLFNPWTKWFFSFENILFSRRAAGRSFCEYCRAPP